LRRAAGVFDEEETGVGVREPADVRSQAETAVDDALEQLLRAAKPALPSELCWLPDGARLLGGRIEVLHRLGSGAMGVVYEARDRGSHVAVKALHNLNPDQLYRLKKEFRFLSRVTHPNVIVVHELFAEQNLWFFSMEVVHGVPLDRYWALQLAAAAPDAPGRPCAAADIALLRDLLRQIIEGVAAIHDVGLLHRDLKPTNVMVEHPGRIVILDFGLVSDQLPGGIGQTVQFAISGTPGSRPRPRATGTRWA
jgi:serine/threonine protein kinase